ncbi:TPA: hypothetical protein U5E40_000779 [Yersinia enterocolitica]|nr:hypothetical protein [Yersinia enterocolitica]
MSMNKYYRLSVVASLIITSGILTLKSFPASGHTETVAARIYTIEQSSSWQNYVVLTMANLTGVTHLNQGKVSSCLLTHLYFFRVLLHPSITTYRNWEWGKKVNQKVILNLTTWPESLKVFCRVNRAESENVSLLFS